MTTTTDWQDATWDDTGDLAAVTDVTRATTDTDPAPALTVDDMHALMQRNEQLGRENAELRAAMGGWTPQQSSLRQQRDLSGGPARHDLPARTWARMSGARAWPQIPDAALTGHGRAQAEYDSAHHQIQDWRDLAFWAEQEQRKAVSLISGDYWSRRGAIENRYDMEIDRLHTENDDATYAAYVQTLPDYVRGNTTTVATERHTSVYGSVYGELAPERIQANESESPKPITPAAESKGSVNPNPSEQALVPTGAPDKYDPPPEHEPEGDDRVQRMAARVQRRDALAPASRVGASEPTSKSRRSRLGAWLRRHERAATGVVFVALWAAAMATMVVLA